MTPDEFVKWSAEEFEEYQHDPQFKADVANVLARQAAGEDLTIPEIAVALKIPLWIAEREMLRTIAKTQARVVVPDSGAMN